MVFPLMGKTLGSTSCQPILFDRSWPMTRCHFGTSSRIIKRTLITANNFIQHFRLLQDLVGQIYVHNVLHYFFFMFYEVLQSRWVVWLQKLCHLGQFFELQPVPFTCFFRIFGIEWFSCELTLDRIKTIVQYFISVSFYQRKHLFMPRK